MSEFVFENQGTNTYLVYAISPDDVIDSMSLGMLTNNKISGLATTLFTQMDATKYIKYNVSAKVSVEQFFAGAVNRKRLLGVFKGIVNALISAEDYMIDSKTILLDLDYIFTDVSTCETVLICLPIQEETEQHNLSLFFKQIMFSTQFDQNENCDYVARIINYLNSTPVFSLSDFKILLEKIEQNSDLANSTSNAQTNPTRVHVQPAVQSKVDAPIQSMAQKPVSSPVNKVPQTNHSPATVVTHQNQIKAPQSGVVQSTAQNTTKVNNGKKISMFGLLMHYSKENAELYKEQKAEKKNKQIPAAKQSVNKTASTSKPSTSSNGFAIPGQAAPAPTAQPMVPQPHVAKTSPTTQVQTHSVINSPIQQSSYVPRAVPQGQAVNFGETTVLGGGAIGETTVLTAVQSPTQTVVPHLIRLKNNEKISLNKPVFRIGKEKSYVDYFIGDNTAISRSHANFITRDGEYFVIDTNSTNHTFVNGSMINSNEEIQIKHGDTVRLANEDFEFKLY